MNKHYTFQEYFEKFTSIQDSYDYYFELQKEIDRLENIIKEVREKLLCYGETFDLKVHQQMQKELLEILGKDKV